MSIENKKLYTRNTFSFNCILVGAPVDDWSPMQDAAFHLARALRETEESCRLLSDQPPQPSDHGWAGWKAGGTADRICCV